VGREAETQLCEVLSGLAEGISILGNRSLVISFNICSKKRRITKKQQQKKRVLNFVQ